MAEIQFQIVEPNERHPSHYMVVAALESGELEIIGFKDRRSCVIIVDKLRMIFRHCKKCPKKNGGDVVL